MKKDKVLDPYAIDRYAKIPFKLQLLIVKWWFGGALFYFVGLGMNIKGYDLIVYLGMLSGLMNEYMVNRIIKWLTYSRPLNEVLMVPYFNFKSLFLNLIYGLVLVTLIFMTYSGLNLIVEQVTRSVFYMPVEPLLFGFLFFFVDLVLLKIRKLIGR